MLIEISALPPAIQEQILSVQKGELVQFVNHGKLIGNLNCPSEDSLMAAAGLLQGCGIDGLEYERQIRSEWD
ncbi:hypothetical protein [Alysiella crassa]|uniref:Uncharacterized protein n=1 Tax=Alysiella crassa TaxID=153491 RepID=A0A376BSF1_9NEIS|nr:hypothetical protein [Alysiella crassa]UOP07847.1 hypothetical protein LVJ80_05805 [Alysiella crassa]SSY79705.1 Uncharacterised protein [Alysiella crassa]